MAQMTILLGLGVIMIVAGVALLYGLKRRVGAALMLMGGGWIFTMLLYGFLKWKGLYGVNPAEAGYIHNIIALILIIVGLVGGIYWIKKAKG